jgi:hypothetical protein
LILPPKPSEVEELARSSNAARKEQLRRALVRRVRTLKRTAKDDELAALSIAASRSDPVWFINHFCFTYDPRNLARGMPAYVPFELYPRQEELVREIHEARQNQENVVIPKSRGVGATWTLAAYSLWMWIFEPGSSVGWGSRKENLVDQIGDPDSIFEKIRILWKRLPEWFRLTVVPDFSEDVHDNHMRLINPNNGATITGEAGKNIGRGGRKSIYFVDESAHVENPTAMNRAVLENTECLVEISTPNGIGNAFERKVKTGKGVRVFWMRWDCVPWRDEAWLQAQKLKYAHDPEGFAQEVLCEFARSRTNICIPQKWIEAAVNYDIPAGNVLSSGYDVAETRDLNVWCSRGGPVVLGFEDWRDLDTTQSARKVVDLNHDWGIKTMCYDAIGVGAGVTGELANHEGDINFWWEGVKVGAAATDRVWPNGKQSNEWLKNLRIELWWTVRERFRKTYENQYGNGSYPPEECISIPDHPELKYQLSWPLYERTSDGKYKLEAKEKMKKRLSTNESCDYADAMMLAFADDVVATGVFLGAV